MRPQTLIIAGIEYSGHCFCDDRYLFVYLDNMSILEGFQILSNPENTATIRAISYGEEQVFTGYTVLKAINTEYGNCNAVLTREALNA